MDSVKSILLSISTATLLASCGNDSLKSQINIVLERPDTAQSLSDAAQTTGPVLNANYCYFVQITGEHPELKKQLVNQSCSGSATSTGPSNIGKLWGTVEKGAQASIEVPSGLKRRIDVAGISKSDLGLTSIQSCPTGLSTTLSTASGTSHLEWSIATQNFSLSKAKLFATGTHDLVPGIQNVKLAYTNGATGTNYYCDESGGGTGTPTTGYISVTSTLDLGSTTIGTTPTSLVFQITNTSNEILSNLSNYSNDHSGNYWQYVGYNFPGTGGDCGDSLAPGASCQLMIEYHPYNPANAKTPGNKTFSVDIGFDTPNSSGLTASLPATSNVIAGPFYTLCLVAPGETFSNGNCPLGNPTIPNLVSTIYEAIAVDLMGNEIIVGSAQSLIVDISEPGQSSEPVNIAAGQSRGSFTIHHKAISSSQWQLSVSGLPGVDAYKYVQVADVCTFAPTHAEFQAGDGSPIEPFILCTATQFKNIENSAANLTSEYMLASDINLSGITLPVGTTASAFSGVLNGNGFKLINPIVGGGSPSGIFAKTEAASIQNLTITDPEITGTSDVGALVGWSVNSTFNNISVSFNSATSFVGTAGTSEAVGGIVGRATGTLTLSHSNVNLGSDPTTKKIRARNNVGAIIGQNFAAGGFVEYVKVHGQGEIFASNGASMTTAGGVVGYSYRGTRFAVVEAGVTIRGSSTAGSILGGIAGNLPTSAASVEKSYFIGSLALDSANAGDKIGGIVGETGHAAVKVASVFALPTSIPTLSGNKGAIIGYNVSSSVCNLTGEGCIHSTSISSAGCGGTSCQYQISGLTPGLPPITSNFTVAGGASALTYGAGDWMQDSTTQQWGMQWEKLARIDSTFSSSYSVISPDQFEVDFTTPAGSSAGVSARATNCKSTGNWYWEAEILEGDYDLEFGILSTSQTNADLNLSFGQSSPFQAIAMRDIGGSFAPYIGNSLFTTDFAYPNYQFAEFGSTATKQGSPGDIIGVKFDLDLDNITFFRNGIQLNQKGNPSATYSIDNTFQAGSYCAAVARGSATSTPYYNVKYRMNFNESDFKYPANMGAALPYGFLQ